MRTAVVAKAPGWQGVMMLFGRGVGCLASPLSRCLRSRQESEPERRGRSEFVVDRSPFVDSDCRAEQRRRGRDVWGVGDEQPGTTSFGRAGNRRF